MAIATGKISVAFLILRILGVAGIWKRRFLYSIIYSVFLCATAMIVVTLTQCIPTRALWVHSVTLHAKCFSPNVLTIFALIISSKFILVPGSKLLRIIGYFTVVDLLLALFPLIIIKDLQMRRRRKIVLSAILGLGVL